MKTMSKRAELFIQLLMDLGEYDSFQAAEIYRKELKDCRSERSMAEKCFILLEKRRKILGLSEL